MRDESVVFTKSAGALKELDWRLEWLGRSPDNVERGELRLEPQTRRSRL